MILYFMFHPGRFRRMCAVTPLLIFLGTALACAPWSEVGGSYESAFHQFSVDIPQGWMKLNTNRYLLISRDGPFLQYVLIQKRHVATPFRHTRKTLNRSMLPEEAAEIIVDEISCDRSIMNFVVMENRPAIVNGHDAFRLLFTYKNSDGLKLKTLYYGLLEGQWFYSIRFTAADRYYFQKDLQTFQKILSSFRVMKDQTA